MSAKQKFQIHARLAKYNEDDHTFEAVATDETIDRTNERMHYDRSKPHFIGWAEEFSKATDGKSVGNLRSMHGKNAAGLLKSMICDDATRSIIVRGEIVDPNDQVKMAKGVYTGVSIGGDAIEKWADEANKGVNWYEAVPCEVSLVDNPCNPNARFMKMAGGVEVEVPLVGDVERAAKIAAEEAEKAAVAALAKIFDARTVLPSTLLKLAEAELTKGAAAVNAERREALMKSLRDENITYGDVEKLAAEWLPESERKGDVPTLLSALFKAGNFTPEELLTIEKREFSQGERDKAADKGQAMPDGSYPIKNKEDLKNAIQAIGRAKNPAAVKRHIKRRAAALGASDLIPDGWGKGMEALTLQKGLGNLGWLANILQELICMADQCEYEAMMEGDGSQVPVRLDMVCNELGEILCEMAEEETQEEAEKVTVVTELRKTLEKVGARNSKADQDRLQAIHDHSVNMGADCGSDDKTIGSKFHKLLGVADDSGFEKALGLLREKAEKWDKQPVRKGVTRAIAKGEDTSEPLQDELPAAVVEKVRAGRSGAVEADIWLIHKGYPGGSANPAFDKIK